MSKAKSDETEDESDETEDETEESESDLSENSCQVLDDFAKRVENGDLENVKLIINSNRWILNNTRIIRHALCVFTCCCDRRICDYFLQCLDMAYPDRLLAVLGEDILLFVADHAFLLDDYPLLALIDKGVDVNFIGKKNRTLLHVGAADRQLSVVAVAAINKGADVNATDYKGKTPLLVATSTANIDWIHILLYYGAIATIPSFDGVLPLTVVPWPHCVEKRKEVISLLLYHTIDENCEKLDLPVVVASMLVGPSVLEAVSEVVYDEEGLEYFHKQVPDIDPQCLRVFIKKFGHVFKNYLKTYSLFESPFQPSCCVDPTLINECFFLITFATIIMEDVFVPEFMEFLQFPTTYSLIKCLANTPCLQELEDTTKTVCFLLSYGLDITDIDLIKVYESFGDCELFRILLHMEIYDKSDKLDHEESLRFTSIACLYFDFTRDLETLLETMQITETLLSFFNSPRLKERCLHYISLEGEYDLPANATKKLKSLPSIPLLTELSRNVARKFIVNRYNIKKSVQFYTVLNWLPIDRDTRSILALEKKLY